MIVEKIAQLRSQLTTQQQTVLDLTTGALIAAYNFEKLRSETAIRALNGDNMAILELEAYAAAPSLPL